MAMRKSESGVPVLLSTINSQPPTFSRKREPLIGLQLFIKLGPAAWDLHVKAVEINSENLGIENVHQAVDGAGEASGIEFFRQITDDGAFAIVWDSHAVTEHREQGLLAGHEVGLQQMLADRIAGLEFQGFVDPRVLLGHGFFLDENWAQLAVSGKGGDGGSVNILIVGAEPIEDLSNDGGVNGRVKFVGFHGTEIFKWREVNALPRPVARAEIGDRGYLLDAKIAKIADIRNTAAETATPAPKMIQRPLPIGAPDRKRTRK